jgi:hypothetical protein
MAAKLGHSSKWQMVLLALAGLSLSGCSSSAGLNPVEGRVLYQDRPLGGALVAFHPEAGADINTENPVGFTKEDGTFRLTTGQDDGARAGRYKVTIICSQMPTSAKKSFSTGGVDSVDILKGAYAQVDASKIAVEIKPGPNQLEPFKLK